MRANPPQVFRFDRQDQVAEVLSQQVLAAIKLAVPQAIAIAEPDRLYIADQTRIAEFTITGSPTRSVPHGFPDSEIFSLRAHPERGIYLASFDVFERRTIHQYAHDGSPIRSFSESYAFGKDLDVYAEEYFAGGFLDIGADGHLYFTQQTPYEVRIYSLEGALERTISRENDFMNSPQVEVRPDGTRLFPAFAASTCVLALSEGRVFNAVRKPRTPNPRDPATTILDLFDREGNLLATATLDEEFTFYCKDAHDRVYAVPTAEPSSIVSFSVEVDGQGVTREPNGTRK